MLDLRSWLVQCGCPCSIQPHRCIVFALTEFMFHHRSNYSLHILGILVSLWGKTKSSLRVPNLDVRKPHAGLPGHCSMLGLSFTIRWTICACSCIAVPLCALPSIAVRCLALLLSIHVCRAGMCIALIAVHCLALLSVHACRASMRIAIDSCAFSWTAVYCHALPCIAVLSEHQCALAFSRCALSGHCAVVFCRAFLCMILHLPYMHPHATSCIAMLIGIVVFCLSMNIAHTTGSTWRPCAVARGAT